MTTATAASAAATLLAVAFTCCTYERWLRRRRRHELAWTISFALFTLASLAFWAATAVGWKPWLFRVFYLLGGIATVPVLALGTIYLLFGRKVGDRTSAVVALVCAYATGVVTTARFRVPLQPDQLNEGRVVFGVGPRALAAVGSGLGALVVIGGALWSARLAVRTRARGQTGNRSGNGSGNARAAWANLLIALGTLTISNKRPFVALSGSDEAGFALALAAGLAVIFAGFLVATVAPGTTGTTGAATAAGAAMGPGPVRRPATPGAPASRPNLRAIDPGTRSSSGTCSEPAGPRRTG